MSTLIVPVATVDSVAAHPNADRLLIASILGWQVIVGKDALSAGDSVLYVPPDAMVPREWGEHWGVWKYLSVKESTPDNGRVRAVKLRGEPSYGFAVPLGSDDKTRHHLDALECCGEGTFAEWFGIEKYEPPIRTTAGDAVPEHALFSRYTDIENLRNFPTILQDGEPVVVTEKIHGTNCRIGVIDGEVMAGSHKLQRARPDNPASSDYWFPLTLDGVARFLNVAPQMGRQVILYGEVYGKVQSLHYGLVGKLGFRAFDMLVDGKYLDWQTFKETCLTLGVPVVPVLYEGPFSLDAIKAMSNGQTTLDDTHYREGVVVKPMIERRDDTIGRVALKYVGDQFLTGDADQTADF